MKRDALKVEKPEIKKRLPITQTAAKVMGRPHLPTSSSCYGCRSSLSHAFEAYKFHGEVVHNSSAKVWLTAFRDPYGRLSARLLHICPSDSAARTVSAVD